MMIVIFSLYEFSFSVASLTLGHFSQVTNFFKIIFLQLNMWLSVQVKQAAICRAPLPQKLVMGFSNFSQKRRASSLTDQLSDSKDHDNIYNNY